MHAICLPQLIAFAMNMMKYRHTNFDYYNVYIVISNLALIRFYEGIKAEYIHVDSSIAKNCLCMRGSRGH